MKKNINKKISILTSNGMKKFNKNLYKLSILILLCLISTNVVMAIEVTTWNYTKTGLTNSQGPFTDRATCQTDLFKFKVSNPLVATTECVSSVDTKTVTAQVTETIPVLIDAKVNEIKNKSVYNMLVPIGGINKMSSSSNDPACAADPGCIPNNIGKYLNVIFRLAIGISAALAVVMLIINGVTYMGDESVFGKTEARKKMFSAIIGLLIALGAWALLNTINPALTGKGGLNIDQVSIQVDPEVHGDTPQTPRNGKVCSDKYKIGDNWGDDSSIRSQLQEKNISINKNNCTKVGDTNCTSVTGLNISKVVDLKTKCGTNCIVQITGATECWLHSYSTQHLPGNSIVDLSFNSSPSLKAYIETGITPQQSNMGFPVYTKNNTKFMKETNHYHIISW